ncbi:uncharacterized protein PgNI_02129 [Pyricularia grisea]|uniref:FAD-binding FR-type domain-containing protein n=1 Tax=Pyricularia grisea TaxID=148305 RepID=A0A6P8BMT8_PYRGI|nr:uncharacterized protein PgNI_02129 [Pyricularia grisea]TLD17787.1 hypothetical protein PgNI_02129 [Pyricularia grisea]
MVHTITPLRAFLVISLISIPSTIFTHAATGIVGYGIDIFPDLCCQSCYDSLSTLYLSCTTFDNSSSMAGMDMSGMDMSMSMAVTSDACRASNQPWLQTMAYCIQQGCDAVGFPADKQEQCFATRAVAGSSQPSFEDSLPSSAPVVEVASNATWLNVTSLVNAALYTSTYGTYQEFAREEGLHSTYSLVIILTMIGMLTVYGLWVQLGSSIPGLAKPLENNPISPWIQQHLVIRPFLGSRRLEPLPGQLGYSPRRILGIFIALYVILNVVLCSVSFGSFQPNIYFMSRGFELCEYVGNRSGILSFVNMAIAILFAGRNNIFIALTGWSHATFLVLHRWTARIAALQAVVHSIVYTIAYFQPGYSGAAAYAEKTTEPFFQWGIVATVAMCLAVGLAILPLRARFYETFLFLHISLVVISLVGCWYHIVPHFGLDYGYQVWLYIAFAFWSADRLARIVRVLFFNRLGQSEAIVEAVPGTDLMQVTFFPRTMSGFGPGQHTFLYIPQLGKPWENHPFTIAGWTAPKQASPPNSSSDAVPFDSSPAEEAKSGMKATTYSDQSPSVPSIRVLVRTHSGATAALQKKLLATAPGSRMGVSVYNEGPYGGHRANLNPFVAAETVLCILGGIGVTSALGFLQSYVESRGDGQPAQGDKRLMKKTTRFIFAWSAREAGLIQYVKDNYLTDVEGVEYRLWCTGPVEGAEQPEGSAKTVSGKTDVSATSGRMDIGAVLQDSLEEGVSTTVMCCGPGGMLDETTSQVSRYLGQGYKVKMVEELYTW